MKPNQFPMVHFRMFFGAPRMHRTRSIVRAACTAVAALTLAAAPHAYAQDRPSSKSALRFDHYRDFDQLMAESKALAAAHPSLLTYVEIGKSSEGRPMFALVLNNGETGPDTDKPAMYIDGNIHFNYIYSA